MTQTPMPPHKAKLAQTAWEQLQPADRDFLLRLAALAGPARVALVGGAVRDALLGGTPLDLDVVVESDLEAPAKTLAQATGLPYVYHPAFGNATLTLPDGRSVDLVRSRRESYPVAGQNPVPTAGTLEDDLRRRDFSVNSLALLPPTSSALPQLLDVVGGLDDVQARKLRPLHPHSFSEDASRLVRGARLAARLGLQATPELLRQVPDALALAPRTPRLWAELKLLLAEPRPLVAAQLLSEWGAAALLPLSDRWLNLWAELDRWPEPAGPQLYAATLLAAVPDPHAWTERLNLGEKPLGLLARAQSEVFYPAHSPEMRLRGLLRPESYLPLTGKDVLALGVPAGKGIGEALRHLAQLRRTGQVRSAEEEQEALRGWLGAAGQ